MNQLPLLANKFKKPGMLIFILCLALGGFAFITNIEPSFLQYDFSGGKSGGSISDVFGGTHLFNSQGNFIDEIIILGIIIGGCLWGFSKEKEEDEFLMQIRLNALIWAFLINYLLIALCTIFVYDFWYLNVMLFNLVTPLVIFLIRFNYLLLKIRNS
jgi:hypothetical protein